MSLQLSLRDFLILIIFERERRELFFIYKLTHRNEKKLPLLVVVYCSFSRTGRRRDDRRDVCACVIIERDDDDKKKDVISMTKGGNNIKEIYFSS